MKIGDRVVIKSMPFQGRTGTIVKRGWFLFTVECDAIDLLGRRNVRTSKSGLRKAA